MTTQQNAFRFGIRIENTPGKQKQTKNSYF